MSIKNYFLGFYILILPIFLFLDTSNLRQISNKSIIFILISVLFVFFIILSLKKLYQFIFKLKVDSNIFPGLCFAFYFQFYYFEIKQLFDIGTPNSGFITFIFLTLLSIFIIFLWSKYFEFLNKFSIIFSALITLTFIYNFYIFSSISSKNIHTTDFKVENNSNNIDKNKSFNNVYFIIFDGMMPLETFKKNTIFKDKFYFNINDTINQFNDDFEYIEGSVSNYNNTKLSVSSIFHNKYFLNDKSNKFKNYNNFYPYFLYNQNKINKLNLLKILKKNGVKFTWFSNSTMPCKNVIGIICGSSSSFETDVLNEIKTFYTKTPILTILEKLTRSLENDIPSDDLLDYIKDSNKIENKNNFFFIHNMLPNGSTTYDNNCNIVERKQLNYSHGYVCSIKKITELTELISRHDENALVLITADHGVASTFLDKESKVMGGVLDGDRMYDPRIFTLIKFPKNCSYIAPKSYDTLNLVRYLLNCNYSQKLDYLPYFHFRAYAADSKNFGKLIDVTKNVKKYLNDKKNK